MSNINWNALGRLPLDLLFDILSQQSVKTLCISKCVSKEWNCLIQTPDLLQKVQCNEPLELEIGRSYFTELDVVTIQRNGIGKIEKRHHLKRIRKEMKFCQGLTCYHGYHSGKIYVYNITCEEYFSLPILPYHNHYGIEFGFDPSSNKYMVLSWDLRNEATTFYLLILGEEFWERVITLPDMEIDFDCHDDNIGAINGIMYWAGRQDGEPCIISFNLATKSFGFIQLPPKFQLRSRDMYSVFDFDSSSCLVQFDSLYQLDISEMWMLKDIKNSTWVSIMKKPILPLEGTKLLERGQLRVQFFSNSSEILVTTSNSNCAYIFVYCFLTCQFTRVDVEGIEFKHFNVRRHVQNYVRFPEYNESDDDHGFDDGIDIGFDDGTSDEDGIEYF